MLFFAPLLVQDVQASCDKKLIQTMFGGYDIVHGVTSIVFDIQESSNDMVVGGLMKKNTSNLGFVYFIDESLCKVRWLLENETFDSGVQHIAFSPQEPTQIYGLAYGTTARVTLFKIDNMFPQATSGMRFQVLTTHSDLLTVNFHMPPN